MSNTIHQTRDTLPPFIQGRREAAAYLEAPVPLWQGNPFIEALPELWTVKRAAKEMEFRPPYKQADTLQPTQVRMAMVDQIRYLVKPLSTHLNLFQTISTLIRTGYVPRNPLAQSFLRTCRERSAAVTIRPQEVELALRAHGAPGLAVVGCTGMGKSTALTSILVCFPQVIEHACYKDRPFFCKQVVWLKLDCPHDGSRKALCLDFFRQMDTLLQTDYARQYRIWRKTTDELLIDMAELAELHGVGILVIDEIQHLRQAHDGGDAKMLNYLVNLMNVVKMPVVLIGTFQAARVLGSAARQARRSSGLGDFIWDRMPLDEEFGILCDTLWKFQYLQKTSPCTDLIKHTLHQESAGITDLLVKIFILAQIRALALGHEDLTVGHIRAVAKDSFGLLRPLLLRLRRQIGPDDTVLLEDLMPMTNWEDMKTSAFRCNN